jgi:translation initiation factor 5A
MAEHEESEFQGAGDAGASATYPQQAGTIKKNGYCILKGRPCKIVDIAISKTGKHGHAKARFTGLDIFTGNKYEDMCPTSHNMEVPVVVRKDFQLVDITGEGFVSLMGTDGDMKDDLRVPADDVGASIRSMFEEGKPVIVSVIGAMGEEKVVAAKENREE